jgi:hypothetical protein
MPVCHQCHGWAGPRTAGRRGKWRRPRFSAHAQRILLTAAVHFLINCDAAMPVKFCWISQLQLARRAVRRPID